MLAMTAVTDCPEQQPWNVISRTLSLVVRMFVTSRLRKPLRLRSRRSHSVAQSITPVIALLRRAGP